MALTWLKCSCSLTEAGMHSSGPVTYLVLSSSGVPVFTLIIILATIYTLAFVMAMAWVIWLWMRRENSKTDIFFAIPNPPVSRSNSYKQVGVY